MSSGTAFGTLGDPPGPLKTYVFLKEFNDFHYCGNPGFSLVSVAHPRRPGRPPGTDVTAQPHSAPRAVCTFYIILFTILFTTLRFPKSTATPDHGVGGFCWGLRPHAPTLQRAIAPQLPRRDDKRRSGPTVNVDTVCDLTRDVPESLHSFQSSNSLWFADFIQKFELVVVCGSACTPASSFNSKEAPRRRLRSRENDF